MSSAKFADIGGSTQFRTLRCVIPVPGTGYMEHMLYVGPACFLFLAHDLTSRNRQIRELQATHFSRNRQQLTYSTSIEKPATHFEKQATAVDVFRVERNPRKRRLKRLAPPAPILVAIDHCVSWGSIQSGGGGTGRHRIKREAAPSKSSAVVMPSCTLGNLNPADHSMTNTCQVCTYCRYTTNTYWNSAVLAGVFPTQFCDFRPGNCVDLDLPQSKTKRQPVASFWVGRRGFMAISRKTLSTLWQNSREKMSEKTNATRNVYIDESDANNV